MSASVVSSRTNTVVKTMAQSSTLTLTNDGGNGTATLVWFQEGKRLRGNLRIVMAGAGDAAQLRVTLPNSLQIDSSEVPAGTESGNTSGVLGNGEWFDAGNAFFPIRVKYASATQIQFSMATQIIFGSQLANTDVIDVELDIPIVGF